MTAAGKITAARLQEGDRIMVTMRLSANQHEAIEVVEPSTTKRKNAHAATVMRITRNPVGSTYLAPAYGGGSVRRTRRRSDFDIAVKIDRDVVDSARTLHNVTPSQTFWMA